MQTNKNIIMCVLLVAILGSVGIGCAEIPATPVSLESDITTSGHVNFSWVAGSGNITNTYNVSTSISGAARTWDNSSANTYANNSPGLDGWAEIWVYAYNTTGSGNLSAGYLYADVQAQRSQFGELTDLMNAIPTILAPVPSIIIVMIEIMAYMAVGGLIIGVLGAVVIAIRKGLDMKKGMK